MTQDDEEPPELPGELLDDPQSSLDANDVGKITEGVRLSNAKNNWEPPAAAVDFLGVKWMPALVEADRKWALHVHLSERVQQFVIRRLIAARSAGYAVHVALQFDALFEPDTLRLLAELDAYVYVIDDPSGKYRRRHFLAAIADIGVPVSPELRMELATTVWAHKSDGTGHERGRRLEAMLAFILGQITDFRIFSRNFRTATQEIDIVVQLDNFSTRCWSTPGVPFILVEAKNTEELAGQPVISLLIQKIRTKRGKSRLGLLFSVAGFTSDAKSEELRLSETNYCVAMFDGAAIGALVSAHDLDDHLAKLVGEAMLR